MERQRKWGRERKERGLLFAPYFLLTFCSILLRMTSAGHPRSFSFSFPLPFILCFSSSFHWPFPSCVRFPSLWNYLFCLTCRHTQHIHSITYKPTVYLILLIYLWIICMCLSECYKTTNWNDFLMMRHGTYPTCCPCESLSPTHTLTHTHTT